MEKFKYYTLFGVEVSVGKNMEPVFKPDFLYRWTSNERKSVNIANSMVDNQLFKTTKKEAIDALNLNEECTSISGIKSRLMFCPQISAHLFETDFVLTHEDINVIIESANSSEHGRKLLSDSKVRI